MPKAKENKTAVMSSELGDGDFAINRNPRTGRPMRKCHKADSPFVDSAVAISDEDSSDDESVMALATRTKKRKRTPSPPLSDDDGFSEASLEDAIESDEDAIAVRPSKRRELYTPTPAFAQGSSIVLKDVVVNVPAGHVGPVVLHLTPDMGKPPPPPPSPRVIVNDPPKRSKRPTQSPNSTKRSGAGFLDLPAELRNEIYSLVFVADSRFDLARPTNFARSAAFLRTCRQVHQEACGILYGENEFFFARRTDRHGSFWEDDWKELGFKVSTVHLSSSFESIPTDNTTERPQVRQDHRPFQHLPHPPPELPIRRRDAVSQSHDHDA